MDNFCNPDVICKCNFCNAIGIRSVWLGLGFFRNSKHSLAPVFTPVGSVDTSGSDTCRTLFQSQKSEKKLSKISNEIHPGPSFKFANCPVHRRQCGGDDFFLYELKFRINKINTSTCLTEYPLTIRPLFY